MVDHYGRAWSRRDFLGSLALAGTAGLIGSNPKAVSSEPPPETTTIRLTKPFASSLLTSTCFAPQFIAEEFLKAEGFTNVKYVETPPGAAAVGLVSGKADISMAGGHSEIIIGTDVGEPIVTLSGLHVGCYELFGTEGIHTIGDLKGRTVAIPALNSGPHVFLASMAAYVHINPNKDIRWTIHSPSESVRLMSEGKIDAYLAFPPQSQEMRAKKIGHVIVNTMMDKPWSQYFCCMVAANRVFMRKNPIATKRALRALLRATDLCAREPERVARFLVDTGYARNDGYTLEALRDIPYNVWRDYNPEDTLRFYALRLKEIGFIKSLPNDIIARGTDWRFLSALKKELKA